MSIALSPTQKCQECFGERNRVISLSMALISLVSYDMALVSFCNVAPTSWFAYARWCPNVDSLVFGCSRKFSTKTIGSVSRQYFTFTDVDFYNPKLEAVKRKVVGEYNSCMHLYFFGWLISY